MTPPTPTRRRSPFGRRRVASALLSLAQFGYAQSFFGNLYEATARIPQRLADGRDLAAAADEPVGLTVLLRPGSPVRYHLPAVPITVVGTLGALAAGWKTPAWRWVSVASGCGAAADVVTSHIVRDVNLKLFFASTPPSPAEQEQLLRTWYRLNVIRLLAAGAAWMASQRARSHLS